MVAQFRRPAMLKDEDAEQLIGDADPAGELEFAHTTAQVLLGRESGKPTLGDNELDLSDLTRIVATHGVDVVAELWARAPANTLPGSLWRLYLVNQWWDRDPATVRTRLTRGANALEQVSIADALNLAESVHRGINNLMSGKPGVDLAHLLRACATVIRIMSEDATAGASWITDHRDELADQVTLRSSALRETARELIAAAALEAENRLD